MLRTAEGIEARGRRGGCEGCEGGARTRESLQAKGTQKRKARHWRAWQQRVEPQRMKVAVGWGERNEGGRGKQRYHRGWKGEVTGQYTLGVTCGHHRRKRYSLSLSNSSNTEDESCTGKRVVKRARKQGGGRVCARSTCRATDCAAMGSMLCRANDERLAGVPEGKFVGGVSKDPLAGCGNQKVGWPNPSRIRRIVSRKMERGSRLDARRGSSEDDDISAHHPGTGREFICGYYSRSRVNGAKYGGGGAVGRERGSGALKRLGVSAGSFFRLQAGGAGEEDPYVGRSASESFVVFVLWRAQGAAGLSHCVLFHRSRRGAACSGKKCVLPRILKGRVRIATVLTNYMLSHVARNRE
ncbi:hypothetical protein GOBAR_AA04113 [Gossypium barbadense]|uniref:Uncharacterized protein n=1 Tax=Gossypium barbadense TaxID=3634 RepID=A0A2P5YLJ9_GOSBA|nr:hypothetical protein GOBAR_AA04113 [Gossypium barbadense]